MALQDKIRITASFSGVGGELRQFVWHYIQAVAGDPGWTDVLSGIVTILASAWAEVAGQVSDQVAGTECALALWDDGLGEWNTVATESIASIVGTSALDAFPGNVACYVTFFTQKARSRGKKFLFDLAENTVDFGLVDTGLIVDLAGFGGVLNNNAVVGGVVYTPGNFNTLKDEFNTWSNVEIGTSIFSGSQYRRLIGRGA